MTPEVKQAVDSLVREKKRWDALERELRSLREGGLIEGRIGERVKADLILRMEAGWDIYECIKAYYPQFLYQGGEEKKGCLGLIVLGGIFFACTYGATHLI